MNHCLLKSKETVTIVTRWFEWQPSKLEFVNERLNELDTAIVRNPALLVFAMNSLDILGGSFQYPSKKYADYFPLRKGNDDEVASKVSGKIHGPTLKDRNCPYRDYSMDKLIFDIENIPTHR